MPVFAISGLRSGQRGYFIFGVAPKSQQQSIQFLGVWAKRDVRLGNTTDKFGNAAGIGGCWQLTVVQAAP